MDLQQIAIARGLFEGLILLDEKTLTPMPGAAERWEISEDGRTYTFFLRANGRWSSGNPLAAWDFAYAIRRILSPELASPAVSLLFPLEGAREFYEGNVPWETVGVRVPDTHCLELTLRKPTPYFLSLLAHPAWSPLCRENVEAHGDMTQRDTPWTRAGNLVSNGPYRLLAWRVGDRVLLGKNPFHWADLEGAPDTVAFYPIGDVATEQNAYENGELDITATIPPSHIEGIRRKDPESLREVEGLGAFYYMFNCETSSLANRHLRRALALAIDRGELCQLLGREERFVAGNLVPPGVGGYTYGGERVIFNPEAARKELALAGYGSGASVPPLQLTFNTAQQHRMIAQAVQEMWRRELGIAIELRSEEWKSFLLTRRTGNFSIARGGWIGDYNDPLTFLELFRSDGTNNFTRWKNSAFDGALDGAEAATSSAERLRHFQEAEVILMREMPILPLYFETNKHRVSPRLRGWFPNLIDYHLYQNMRLSSE